MGKEIGVIIGSLRKGSFSRQIANYIMSSAPDGMTLSEIDISGLPIYNQDFDGSPEEPESYKSFREKVAEKDGFIFVTPEYNRSIPGGLKNALDVASRPAGENVWSGKPAAIVSTSPGMIGGFGANHHLRQVVSLLNMPAMPLPEMYVSKVADALDSDGNLTNEKVREMLDSFLSAYKEWAGRF